MFTARRVTMLLVAVLGFYFLLLGQRGLLLVQDGRPVFVLLGAGVLLLPVVGAVLVWGEIRFGRSTERLGRALAAEGGLPADDLERTPSGRIDRGAADALFAQRKVEVEAAPGDWRAWFRLAVAYGDAGDTRRGRRAMRHAVALHAEQDPEATGRPG